MCGGYGCRGRLWNRIIEYSRDYFFLAAAQTSALSSTLAGENGRCFETDYLGEKAYDGHHLPMVGLVESNYKEVELPGMGGSQRLNAGGAPATHLNG